MGIFLTDGVGGPTLTSDEPGFVLQDLVDNSDEVLQPPLTKRYYFAAFNVCIALIATVALVIASMVL